MSRDSAEGQLLTAYEVALDSHHKSLPFWGLAPAVRPFALLAAFESLAPLFEGVLLYPWADSGEAQSTKEYHEALVHAFRFLWQDSWRGDLAATCDPVEVSQARKFLLHAHDFGVIADCHVGFNRGLFRVEVDSSQHRVRFEPVIHPGATTGRVGFEEDYPARRHEQLASLDLDAGRTAIAAVRGLRHHLDGGRLVIEDLSPLKSEAVRSVLGIPESPHFMPLEDGEDLGGVTAAEFRQFWGALRIWSGAASILHLDAVHKGRGRERFMTVQVVPRAAFVSHMMCLSELPEQVVVTLLERLTFGAWAQKCPDIFLQPLVAGPSAVGWSPYAVQVSAAERNMLKLMSRGPKSLKDKAASIIGKRERVMLRRIGDLLQRQHGYQYKREILLPENRGEVDLLSYHTRHPDQLLLVEVKGVLDVDEVNEMHQATEEMISGQEQLRRAARLMTDLPVPAKRALWSQPRWEAVANYYSVVVTPNSQANTLYDHREIPAVTLETVVRHFHPRHFRSPQTFWQACASKPWLDHEAGRAIYYSPVEVGGITYELPVTRS